MIYDWYRGSDPTGRLPKEFIEWGLSAQAAENVEELLVEGEAIVAREQDPNMRGLFFWLTGSLLWWRNKPALAFTYFRRAYWEFDPLAASFPAVVDAYVATCRRCSGDWSEVVEDDSTGLPEPALLELIVALWGERTSVAPALQPVGLGLVATYFLRRAEEWRSLTLCELARVADARAHRSDTEAPLSLWGVFQASYYLGRRKDCERILEMLEKVDYQGEVLQWARQWGLPRKEG